MIRSVDDYLCFCDTYEKAQEFILILEQTLAGYKLTLNLNKTYIAELPCPSEDDWILELLGAIPNRFSKPDGQEPNFSSSEAITFINRAINVNKATPDGSVLKYAIQLVSSHLDEGAAFDVLISVLNLAWHYPILIPYLDVLIDKANISPDLYTDQLNKIILENSKKKRSDGVAWPLYILKKNYILPSETIIDSVISSGDCISITILSSMLNNQNKIVKFINEIIVSDNYTKDNYWLLLYQLYFENILTENPYDDEVFPTLKNYSVNFLPGESITQAENNCDLIKNPFISDERRKEIISSFS